MGRELKRVPLDFKWPTNQTWNQVYTGTNWGICAAIEKCYYDDLFDLDTCLKIENEFNKHRNPRINSAFDWNISDTQSRIDFINQRIANHLHLETHPQNAG